MSKLEDAISRAGGIDGLCTMIAEGESIAAVARTLGVNRSELIKWYDSDPIKSARVLEARRTSAFSYADKAEQALAAIPDDARPGEIARQRELASHYRWEAKIRSPKLFGDKLDVSGEVRHVADPAQLEDKLRSLLGGVAALADQSNVIDVTPTPVETALDTLDSPPDQAQVQ